MTITEKLRIGAAWLYTYDTAIGEYFDAAEYDRVRWKLDLMDAEAYDLCIASIKSEQRINQDKARAWAKSMDNGKNPPHQWDQLWRIEYARLEAECRWRRVKALAACVKDPRNIEV